MGSASPAWAERSWAARQPRAERSRAARQPRAERSRAARRPGRGGFRGGCVRRGRFGRGRVGHFRRGGRSGADGSAVFPGADGAGVRAASLPPGVAREEVVSAAGARAASVPPGRAGGEIWVFSASTSARGGRVTPTRSTASAWPSVSTTAMAVSAAAATRVPSAESDERRRAAVARAAQPATATAAASRTAPHPGRRKGAPARTRASTTPAAGDHRAGGWPNPSSRRRRARRSPRRWLPATGAADRPRPDSVSATSAERRARGGNSARGGQRAERGTDSEPRAGGGGFHAADAFRTGPPRPEVTRSLPCRPRFYPSPGCPKGKRARGSAQQRARRGHRGGERRTPVVLGVGRIRSARPSANEQHPRDGVGVGEQARSRPRVPSPRAARSRARGRGGCRSASPAAISASSATT